MKKIVGGARLITLNEIKSGNVRVMAQYHVEKLVGQAIELMHKENLLPIGPLHINIQIETKEREDDNTNKA